LIFKEGYRMKILTWKRYSIITTVVLAALLLLKGVSSVIPIFDDGHRCYEVPNEAAAGMLLKVFALADLEEKFTFDSGPTHQCVLSDGNTVLLWLDAAEKERGGIGNARSLVVSDPREAARRAGMILRAAGYTAVIREPEGLGDNKLVLLETSACTNWCIVFRRHALKMGKPETRSISR
jgi:hypothetical protein